MTSMTSRTEYSMQTQKTSTLFSGQYLRNDWTLDIGVLGYIGIVWPKEHSPEVRSFYPGTPRIYTECPRGNVPDFRRMFLKLKYTDIAQNTYIRSWTITEIMAIEKCDLLAVPRTVPVSRDVLPLHCACPSFSLQPGQVHSRCDLVSKVVTVTINCEEL